MAGDVDMWSETQSMSSLEWRHQGLYCVSQSQLHIHQRLCRDQELRSCDRSVRSVGG